MNVVNVGAGVECNHLYTVFALLAGDVLNVHVAHHGKVSAAAYLIVIVVEVDFQHRLATLTHLNVAGIDVLYHTATAGVGLDAHHTVEIGAVHLVVLGKHVAATATDFATDYHATVSVFHFTVTDDDVLAGFAP